MRATVVGPGNSGSGQRQEQQQYYNHQHLNKGGYFGRENVTANNMHKNNMMNMPNQRGGVPMNYDPKRYVGEDGIGRAHDLQQIGGGNRRYVGNPAARTHFYPEGGWGWIVCACAFLAHVKTSGAQLSTGALHIVLANKFQDTYHAQHWLGPFSWSVSCICSPLVVNLCRRKNVRILSLIGGCLFPTSLFLASFVTEIHQFFFTFGVLGGIGASLVRESSGIVLGEYFRRRRQFVEQVVLAGTGVGVTLFSLLYLSLNRHINWAHGFQIGAGLSMICALLPAFYKAAANFHPHRTAIHHFKEQKARRQGPTLFLPLDICHNFKLFCVPSLKPVLWSSAIAGFGLYAPLFLMSDFGKDEGLSSGSLLLLQTHLGLGLSLGVILGAILTLKKFRCCHVSPRMLCCFTGILTGLSMIAISSVKGYYGYSLSAWIFGIALGSYLYTLRILTLELTRPKHWERIWACIQSVMGPGILIGTGLTSYVGKAGFYGCASCVLIGSGILGFELIDISKCGSPQLSSLDTESPIPPAPPPAQMKYQPSYPPQNSEPYAGQSSGFYPLRRSLSLQQPIPLYPCCYGSEPDFLSYPSAHYSPHCPDCNPRIYMPKSMVRSHSLPAQADVKNTGTQTNPNSPVSLDKRPTRSHPGSFNILSSNGSEPIPRTSSFRTRTRMPSQKNTVVFASNPQLFPLQQNPPRTSPVLANGGIRSSSGDLNKGSRSNRSSTERFPDFPIEPQYFPATQMPFQQQEPAFTRHYFDSSQITRTREQNPVPHQVLGRTNGQQQAFNGAQSMSNPRQTQMNHGHHYPERDHGQHVYSNLQHHHHHQPSPGRGIQNQQQNHVQQGVIMDPYYYNQTQQRSSTNNRNHFNPYPLDLNYHHHHQHKISSSEFDISQPQFNSLRRPGKRNSGSSTIGPSSHYHPYYY